MFYRRKSKGFFYYFKVAFYALICVSAIGYYYLQHQNQKTVYDGSDILANSVLKDKKFAAEIKEIQAGDISAYLMEEHSNPIVSVSFEFENAGYAYDKKDKFGLADIASDLIMAGAGNHVKPRLLDMMEENGIKTGFGVSKDSFSSFMIFPKANIKTAQYLLKLIINNPRLPEVHLATIKMQKLKALQMQKENPNSVLSLSFNEKIFSGHPYSRNPIGTEDDIKNISSDDVRSYLTDTLAKDNLIVGISGDISETEAQNLINNVFGNLNAKSKNIALEKFNYASNGEQFNVKREIPQVIAEFSAAGTYRESKDFYPLYLANYIFGESGLNSRLNKTIREEKGLTYGIYTVLSSNNSSALIRGKFSAAAENYEQAKALLLEQWHNMALYGISEEELESTKKSLIDSFNLRFAAIDDVSDMLVAMQKHKLGTDFLQKRNDYIKNVTLDEVNRAAAKYFGEEPDFVTIGTERNGK